MKPVAKIAFASADVAKQVEPLVDRFNETIEVPILQGRLLENVSITENQTNRVRHGLGRKLRGWIVVRQTVEEIFFSDYSPNLVGYATRECGQLEIEHW